MKEQRELANKAEFQGVIVGDLSFDHEAHGEKFYLFFLAVKRQSGTFDTIPVIVSERMEWFETLKANSLVRLKGSYRSFNQYQPNGGRAKLLLSVFVSEILPSVVTENINEVILNGFICKEPTYRQTPLGREIAEIILAVNRPYGKSDYIPCICWGRTATFTKNLKVGTQVEINGRVQSREYVKKFADGTQETRTAYEVSVMTLNLIDVKE